MIDRINSNLDTEEINDESKIFYNQIGVVKVSIHDILKHIIVNQDNNYEAIKPIY